MKDVLVKKYPKWRELNDALRPLALDMAGKIPDFRLQKKPDLDSSVWADRHQYFPLESSWHSRDDLYTHDALRPLCDFIKSMDPLGLDFTSMWIKVASKGNAGSKHRHRGIVSGVYYVDVGHLNGEDLTGKINFYPYPTGDKYTVKPSNGDIIIFPSLIQHDVDEYCGTRARINISWNMQ